MAHNSDISPQGTPAGVSKDDIEFDTANPNVARAVPRGEGETVLEQARANSPRSTGTYPDLVEGSDSARTGTSWGVLGREDAERVDAPRGNMAEGEGDGQASPNRNTGEVSARDRLRDTGSWSTIDTDDSAGSPTGNS